MFAKLEGYTLQSEGKSYNYEMLLLYETAAAVGLTKTQVERSETRLEWAQFRGTDMTRYKKIVSVC